MSKMLAWVSADYIRVGAYLLSFGVALLVAVLGAALPQVGITSRLPRWLAGCAGLLLILVSVALTVAKFAWASQLKRVSWLGPSVIGVFGLVLILTAWVLDKHYYRATRRRLQPLADAAWRTVGQVEWPRPTRGTLRLILRTPQGRPVVEELLAISKRRRSASVALLIGAGGGGKTKTLLDLAADCHSAWKKRRARLLIPIYINLTGFASKPTRIPLRNYILEELGQDEELLRSFAEAWRDKKSYATWLFLFDDVDRVLERWPPDQGSYDWVVELVDFLGANGQGSRAIVATDSDPSISDAIRVEIASIDSQSRRAFLASRGVAAAQQDALEVGKSFGQYITNLSWLNFISQWLAIRPSEEPDTFYKLMADCVTQKIASTRPSDADVPDELLYMIAEQVAISLCGYPEGATEKELLVRQLSQDEGYRPEIVNRAMEMLIRSDLMTVYLDPTGNECFRFAHNGIEDYFAVSRLIKMDPSGLNLTNILTDEWWSTIAISLLQQGDKSLIVCLVTAAQDILGGIGQAQIVPHEAMINRLLRAGRISERDSLKHEDQRPPPPTSGYRVLQILDAALQGQHIAESLRDEVDRFIARNFSRFVGSDKAQIINIQNLAHDDVAAATCAIGLRSYSGWFVYETALQITTRSQVLDLLSPKDRVRFIFSVFLIGLNPWTAQHISPAYRERLKFASDTAVATGWLYFFAFGVLGIVNALAHPHNRLGGLIEIILAIVLITTIITARRHGRVMVRLLAGGLNFTFGAFVIAASMGAIGLIAIIISMLEGNLPSLPGLLLVSALLWPMSALFYLAIEPNPTTSGWIFPFTKIIIPGWKALPIRRFTLGGISRKRQTFSIVLLIVGIVDILILSVIMKRGWHFKGLDYNSHRDLYVPLRWLAWIILFSCLCVIPVADLLHDERLLRRWQPPARANDADIVEWVSRLRTSRGIIEVLSKVESELPPASAKGAIDSLNDLWRVFKIVNTVGFDDDGGLTPNVLMMPSLRTPDLAIWLKTYSERYPARLRKIALEHEKPLDAYLTAVQQTAGPAPTPLLLYISLDQAQLLIAIAATRSTYWPHKAVSHHLALYAGISAWRPSYLDGRRRYVPLP